MTHFGPPPGQHRIRLETWIASLILVLLPAGSSLGDDTGLMAVGLRGGVSIKGESPLGEQMRESFVGADMFGVFRLPWSWYSTSGWGVGTRLITSLGAFTALEKVALVSSAAPVVALGTEDGTFA